MVDITQAILNSTAIEKAQQRQTQARPAQAPGADPKVKFEDILRSEMGQTPSVKLSAHAQKRLNTRDIPFGPAEQARLESAVDQAAGKGAQESLILMDDLALVVSVKNRVVITAVDANARKDNVFTNIDSVVLT